MSSQAPVVAPQMSVVMRSFAAEDPGSWEPVIARVVAADRAGVHRVVVSDHVVYGEDLEAYGKPELGGAKGGKQPTGPDGHWLEPITTLAVVAGRTNTIRLGTNILLAALRRPVVLAKQLATLDVLSGGRLDIGVGVGWQREEYEAAGLDFEGRGRQLDHTLEVCQLLWRETRASYSSPELTFENIHAMPKPRQDGGVPLWVSGTVNKRVARRLATFGSGWIPWGAAAGDIVTGIAQMKEAVAAAGRDDWDLQVVGTLPVAKSDDRSLDVERTMAAVPALVEAGVTDFRSNIAVPDDPAEAEDHLSTVVAAFNEATS